MLALVGGEEEWGSEPACADIVQQVRVALAYLPTCPVSTAEDLQVEPDGGTTSDWLAGTSQPSTQTRCRTGSSWP